LKGLATEAMSLIRTSPWRERKTYGSWGILPAIGPFKRTSYPIRLRDKKSNYVTQVQETINALDIAAKLNSISCPVLLIYGTGDRIVDVSNAHEIQNKVKQSDMLLLKGATHFSTIIESEVSKKISSFIKAKIT